MLSWMKNKPIRFRIALSLVLPLLGLIGLSAAGVWERRDVAAEMATMHTLADLAPFVGDLVHELQKERGLSAGFIGSKGQLLAAELPRQQEAVDAALTAYTDALRRFPFQDPGTRMQADISAAKDALALLSAKRQAIRELKLSSLEMAGYYTAIAAVPAGTPPRSRPHSMP
jgi:hypothetical protein